MHICIHVHMCMPIYYACNGPNVFVYSHMQIGCRTLLAPLVAVFLRPQSVRVQLAQAPSILVDGVLEAAPMRGFPRHLVIEYPNLRGTIAGIYQHRATNNNFKFSSSKARF